MPFQSDKQRKKCWVLYNQALARGEKPKWDCHKFHYDTHPCGAKTMLGSKCKNMTSKKRCRLHEKLKKKKTKTKTKTNPKTKRCGAKTTSILPCRRKVQKGRCYQHK